MSTKEKTTRDVTFGIDVYGTADITLEDIVGDKPLEGVDQDAAREKALDALDGCELHGIDLDGLPFVIHLHVK